MGFTLSYHALGAEDVGALFTVRASKYGHVLDHAEVLFLVSLSYEYLES